MCAPPTRMLRRQLPVSEATQLMSYDPSSLSSIELSLAPGLMTFALTAAPPPVGIAYALKGQEEQCVRMHAVKEEEVQSARMQIYADSCL